MARIINSLNDFIEKLQECCNIDCGTTDTEGVTRQAELFASWFQDAGFYAETVDLGDRVGKGVFATNDQNAESYDLLLSGHLDTVFKHGTCKERPVRIEDNRAYGPGVADMKDGDLTVLWALSSLDKEKRKKS